MKNRINIILIIFASLIIYSCFPEEYGSIGEIESKPALVQGKWKISSVIQVDESAVEKNFPFKELELTNLFPYSEFELTLNLDDQGMPSTFSATTADVPEIIGLNEGSWKMDDPARPSKLIFYNGQISDTLEFAALNGLITNDMNLKFTRYQVNSKNEKKAFVSYKYNFEKVQ